MSSFVLSRGYQLQMPRIFVDLDREEMEYIDGGSNTTMHWWGAATDLSKDECSDMSDFFTALAAGAGATYGVVTGIAAILCVPAGVISLIVGSVQTASYGIASARLNTASRRKGATVSMLYVGTAAVNIW